MNILKGKPQKLFSILLVLALVVGCFAALPWTANAATPEFPGDSKSIPLLKNQAPIYLDGSETERLEAVYTGNSANAPGWTKIASNGEKVSITVNGLVVGYFVFDKKGNAPKPYQDFLKIEIYENLPVGAEVTIRWDCSKYYAYADLSVPGIYYIPQLMQDNGKIQSFDQIWINTTYTPVPPPDEYTIDIAKTVNGKSFLTWSSNYNGDDLDSIIAGMTFKLYRVLSRTDPIGGNPVAEGKCNPNGAIDLTFTATPRLLPGLYAIDEELTGPAAVYFTKPSPTYIYLGENNVASTFDYDVTYTIDYDVNDKLIATLGYESLHRGGEIFPIAVINDLTDVRYPSFCAYAGSQSFHDGEGFYVVAPPSVRTEQLIDWDACLAAYNYIEDNFGSLDDYRVITQTVTWILLGAIDVNSIESNPYLESADRDAIQNVIDNIANYTGSGTIVDLAFLVCKNYLNTDTFVDCQPQIVPVYRPVINNTPKLLPYEFTITVYHREIVKGEYLVYPGVGETFSSTDEAYVEWLNSVEGFTFLNLYLAALRTNDPADMASVAGYVCNGVEKNDSTDPSFTLTRNGVDADITALVIPNAAGHYEITFWYAPE